MRLTLKMVERRGRAPELVLTGRRVDGLWRPKLAPRQPLDAGRLIHGGALTGPMFKGRPGLLRRFVRWVRS